MSKAFTNVMEDAEIVSFQNKEKLILNFFQLFQLSNLVFSEKEVEANCKNKCACIVVFGYIN